MFVLECFFSRRLDKERTVVERASGISYEASGDSDVALAGEFFQDVDCRSAVALCEGTNLLFILADGKAGRERFRENQKIRLGVYAGNHPAQSLDVRLLVSPGNLHREETYFKIVHAGILSL